MKQCFTLLAHPLRTLRNVHSWTAVSSRSTGRGLLRRLFTRRQPCLGRGMQRYGPHGHFRAERWERYDVELLQPKCPSLYFISQTCRRNWILSLQCIYRICLSSSHTSSLHDHLHAASRCSFPESLPLQDLFSEPFQHWHQPTFPMLSADLLDCVR